MLPDTLDVGQGNVSPPLPPSRTLPFELRASNFELRTSIFGPRHFRGPPQYCRGIGAYDDQRRYHKTRPLNLN